MERQRQLEDKIQEQIDENAKVIAEMRLKEEQKLDSSEKINET